MADTVTSQILENGFTRWVAKFTNFSDGTGESAVVKVDATGSGPYGVTTQGRTIAPGTNLTVTDIWYDLRTMGLRIQWVATSAVDMLVLGGFGHWRFRDVRAGFQGLVNPATAGATGSIQFTTTSNASSASYTVVMMGLKGVPQS